MLPKLTESEKKQLKIQIEAELYTRSFYEFFKAAAKILYPQTEWDWNWHFKYVCDILQEEAERVIRKEKKSKDIILNLSFRSGKSIMCSQLFPVWCWIKDSSLAIMQVSHSETLAIKHSHASKMLIESEWFQERFPGITLRQDTHAKNNYMTNGGGKRISFGINSGIIGEGADLQIIDDINNPKDSIAVTQSVNEIYTDTVYSRLNNPEIGFRLILQQRVQENDVCGYLLKNSPEKYFHICLPARLAPNLSPIEAAEYYQDGLFWKTRFNEKVLQDFQSTLGSRAFSGQLMQKPTSDQGTIIKRAWVKTITLDEFTLLTDKQKLNWELYVDTAYTKSTQNDPTAVILVCAFKNNIYVLKAWNFWLEFPDLILQLKTIKSQFNVRMIRIESKASGLSIKQQLQRDGFDVADLKPGDKDKITRANGVTPKIEGGHLFLIEDSWNELVLQQLAAFPNGQNDDIVDVIVYSIDNLLNNNTFSYSML